MSTALISEEELNAFVDDQLSNADRTRVLEALGRDEALQKRVAEIQQTRNLLRHAYAQVPLPARASPLATAWQKQALAASLLATFGFATGWFVHNQFKSDTPGLHANGQPKGVVIQVSEADPAKWEMALINARNVRKAYADKNVGVEIVAYGPGLKMLRSDSAVTSGLADAKKNGVKLIACGNTMRMTHTTREQLNPVVDIVPAGIVEIMQRQQEGYAYVRP